MTLTKRNMEGDFPPLLASTADDTDYAKGIHTLYVSPSEISLSNFTEICNSVHFKQHIQQLIFISRAVGNDDQNMNQRISQTLCEGILSLPKLNTISIHNHVTQPGLNAIPQRHSNAMREIDGHNADVDIRKMVHDKFDVANTPIEDESLRGLGTIFDALVFLSHSEKYKNNIRAFNLGNGHSDPLFNGQLPTDLNLDDLFDVFANCSKLTISSSVFHEESVTSDFWQDVCEAACNVKESSIYEDTVTSKVEKYVDVAHIFLEHGELQQLEKLRLYGVHREPGVLHADSFVSFARKHLLTMDDILLEGFLLSNGCVNENVRDTMTMCLSTVRDEFRDELRLSKFEMLVHRRDEHEKWSCTNGGYNTCNGHCKSYRFPHGIVHRDEIDNVAQQLDVSLGAHGWNFGDFVMRSSDTFVEQAALPETNDDGETDGSQISSPEG